MLRIVSSAVLVKIMQVWVIEFGSVTATTGAALPKMGIVQVIEFLIFVYNPLMILSVFPA